MTTQLTSARTDQRIALVGGSVDLSTREVRVGGRTDRLTHREIELLAFLVARAGQTVDRDVLLHQVFGYQPTLSSRVVDTTVSRLRAKIEVRPEQPSHLISAYGAGYRFEPLPSEPARWTERTGIPPERTPLVGRGDEVAAGLGALKDHRRVQLVGPGGVGKSRVAGRIASLADFERVLFVSAAHASSSGEAVALTERALGSPTDGARGEAAAAERVGRALDQRRSTLLVLDCIEHLDGVEALLEGWLALAPTLRILTTSRRAVDGPAIRLACLSPAASTAMYLERAAAAGGGIGADELPVVERLVASLDHLPLAIELAAAKARALSPSQILGRLEARLRLLSGGPRDAEPRAASVRATLNWSWDLLGEADRVVLARLSVFPGPVGREASAAVLGADGVGRLDGLVGASLVQPLDDGWVLLESVRAWASEKADELGVRVDAELAHAGHYADWVDRVSPPGSTLDRDVADRLDQELTHLLAIPARVERARPGLAIRLVSRLWELFQIRGVLEPYLAACDCAVRAATATADPLLPNVLHARATTLRLVGRRAEAERDLETALAAASDPQTRAWIGCETGLVLADRGQLDQADARYREHLPNLGGPLLTSSRAAWAVLRSLRGDRSPEVFDLLRTSLAEAEARGSRRVAASIRGNLGILLIDVEALEEAEPLLVRSLAELRALGATRRLTSVLSGLCVLLIGQGRYEEAQALSAEGETVARVTGHPRWILLALTNQASLELALGDLDEGLRKLDEAERHGAGEAHELWLVELYRAALLARADRISEARAAAAQGRDRLTGGSDERDLLLAVDAHLAWAEARACAAGGRDPSPWLAEVHALRGRKLIGSGARFLASLLPEP